MLRCSFLILSAARSRALRTVEPLPSPTVVLSLSSRTACAAALSLAFSIQLILLCLSFCFYLFESFHGFEDFFSDGLNLFFSLVSRFSLGGFFFGGVFCSVSSVGSVLAGAGFGSAGFVLVWAGWF